MRNYLTHACDNLVGLFERFEMTVLFGHPTGNPNSHHAALAHFEAGRLDAFCVPWMPSMTTLQAMERISRLQPAAMRLSRRHFGPLENAPKVQGPMREAYRLIGRSIGLSNERLAYDANDWLMQTMRRECSRPSVTTVHCYEDCSLLQFAEAKRLGKATVYDMPIGYYPAWETLQTELAQKYCDWLPSEGLKSSRYVRPQQKRSEMGLADLVLVPSSFVENTIRDFHPDKCIARAPYGVDLKFWTPEWQSRPAAPFRFIYAGQLSLRKGIPVLLEAWEKAALRDAELILVGAWHLSENKLRQLPPNVIRVPECSLFELRDHYRAADVFVFPTFFDGFGLVLLEAMACGLPIIASESSAGPDIVNDACGRLSPRGDIKGLEDQLRWFNDHRDELPAMRRAALAQAARCTWENYRRCVCDAVAPFV